MSFEEKYQGFGWIRVKRFVDDESKSWEERFKALEEHHLKETNFLIDEVRSLAKEVDEASYKKGYSHAVSNYAIWRDGQRYVGVLQTPLEKVLEEVKQSQIPIVY